MKSLNSNSQERERELHQLQQIQDKAKESCMASFRLLHSLLQVLSYNDLKLGGGFERAFVALFDQDVQTFTGSTLLNLDQLEKQLDKEEFQETRSMDAFRVLKTHKTKSDHQDTSSKLGNDANIKDADIRPVNDQVPFAEVQLTAPHNVLTNEQ
ncbi:hypothetical protein Tco_0149479 [Tanacetum coccineum]